MAQFDWTSLLPILGPAVKARERRPLLIDYIRAMAAYAFSFQREARDAADRSVWHGPPPPLPVLPEQFVGVSGFRRVRDAGDELRASWKSWSEDYLGGKADARSRGPRIAEDALTSFRQAILCWGIWYGWVLPLGDDDKLAAIDAGSKDPHARSAALPKVDFGGLG